MKIAMSYRLLLAIIIFSAISFVALQSRDRWTRWLAVSEPNSAVEATTPAPITEPKVLKLSEQARKNLGLVSKPAKTQTYWRTIQVPGVIGDRPGISDRGVTSPAVGIVTEIHAFPGDTVQPADPLFTLRPFSESLQNTQTELFKAQRESQLIAEQQARLQKVAVSTAVAGDYNAGVSPHWLHDWNTAFDQRYDARWYCGGYGRTGR